MEEKATIKKTDEITRGAKMEKNAVRIYSIILTILLIGTISATGYSDELATSCGGNDQLVISCLDGPDVSLFIGHIPSAPITPGAISGPPPIGVLRFIQEIKTETPQVDYRIFLILLIIIISCWWFILWKRKKDRDKKKEKEKNKDLNRREH